ncbi:MAG: patatin-like phospholipase family protein [Tepidisphaeraceae bacterium]|jgi:predicted acylesterase/phospholipase RssA
MSRFRWTILLSVILAGCGPGYVNQALYKLSDQGSPVQNSNPRTESYLQSTPLLLPYDRETQAPDESAATNQSVAQAVAGTTGPDVVDSDGCFVGLAISGGGSRSANFAAACMFQLQRLGMLQKVDCISAVSGGTLAAAYYCTCSDADWNPINVQKKLSHSYASDVWVDAFWPWNFWDLLLGNLTRSDLLAQRFNDELFHTHHHDLTFADLRPDRPRLLINTTELESGRRFTFDNSSFDEINSNLNNYPLAYAVAASSAIPIVMPPVPIRDFSTDFKQYYHLVDGGVADNLGVQCLVDSYEAQIQKSVNPYPHGAILIAIDAGVTFNGRLTNQSVLSALQSLLSGLDLSSSVLLNRASSATLAEVVVLHSLGTYTAADLRHFIDQLHSDHYIEIKDSRGNPVRVIHLSLSQIPELTNASFGTSVNSISTNYDIEKNEAYDLYKAAEILFTQRFDARIRPLVAELNSYPQGRQK